MEIDTVLMKYARWLQFLRGKRDEYQEQLARMERKKKATTPGRNEGQPTPTTFLAMALSQQSNTLPDDLATTPPPPAASEVDADVSPAEIAMNDDGMVQATAEEPSSALPDDLAGTIPPASVKDVDTDVPPTEIAANDDHDDMAQDTKSEEPYSALLVHRPADDVG